MNTQATLSLLTSQLQSIESFFGVEACMEHADRVYNQTFRSEPMRICDVLNAHCKTQEEYYTEFNSIAEELGHNIAGLAFEKATGNAKPQVEFNDLSNDDHEDFIDDGYDDWKDMQFHADMEAWNEMFAKWLSDKGLNPADLIKEDSLIVDLCNYKGEGEGGYELFTPAIAQLPVFTSKHDSFNI